MGRGRWPGTLCPGLSHTRDPEMRAVGWVPSPGLELQVHTGLQAFPGLCMGLWVQALPRGGWGAQRLSPIQVDKARP